MVVYKGAFAGGSRTLEDARNIARMFNFPGLGQIDPQITQLPDGWYEIRYTYVDGDDLKKLNEERRRTGK